MTLDELHALTGLSASRFALLILAGRGDRTARRWLADPTTTPERVARWLAHVESVRVTSGRITITIRRGPDGRRS